MSFNTCLLRVPMFKDLDTETLSAISDLIQPLDIHKHETLFDLDDRIENLYILHTGTLQVYDLSEDGTEHTLRTLSEGEFMGENALIQSENAQFGVKALESSHICIIDGHAFRDLLKASPDISIQIIDALLKRLKKSDTQHIDSLSLTSRQRIINALFEDHDINETFTLNTSKKDFALSLNMTPETLSRNLKRLEKEGFIKPIGTRSFKILKRI